MSGTRTQKTMDFLDVEARDMHPGYVITLGKALFICDNSEGRGRKKEAARKTIDWFESLLDHFSGTSKDGAYLHKLYTIAQEFAAGYESCINSRRGRIDAAKTNHSEKVDRIKQKETYGILTKYAIQLIAVCGFFGALMMVIVDVPFLKEYFTEIKHYHLSSAIALLSGLIFAYLKHKKIFRKLDELKEDYNLAVRLAKKRYNESMVSNYQAAAGESRLAYKTLTGKEPPMTKMFKALIELET